MRKSTIVFAALIVSLVGMGVARADDACSSVAGNMVVNCGFETGDFTGWTNSDTTGFDTGVDSLSPFSGNYEAYLGFQQTTGTLSQSITTTAGDVYAITFSVMNDTSPSQGYGNSFDAYFDGTLLVFGTDVNAFQYETFDLDVQATGSSSLLQFVSENDAGFWDIDSVSVVDTTAPPPPPSTPEPGSIALLGTGLLGIAGAARRRFLH